MWLGLTATSAEQQQVEKDDIWYIVSANNTSKLYTFNLQVEHQRTISKGWQALHIESNYTCFMVGVVAK